MHSKFHLNIATPTWKLLFSGNGGRNGTVSMTASEYCDLLLIVVQCADATNAGYIADPSISNGSGIVSEYISGYHTDTQDRTTKRRYFVYRYVPAGTVFYINCGFNVIWQGFKIGVE